MNTPDKYDQMATEARIKNGYESVESYAEYWRLKEHCELELRKLLYRAIYELEMVQNCECHELCASAVGKEIVADGMKLLGVADFSTEELPA